ncbi:ATP-dependent helicase [Leptospira sp. GIMC2001]|uniref:ATP-dependent helicase n=1 Tax=Leptospira sp. GIMC2001 TaxID=1513297 RepID=UPI00234B3314|nr:UvrD-helicase domain-containing protein [Leptospira sp. GIMC2001]WCL51336.1 UvrD-helicase domain-containing protein [Leptospira sp. GIMC2001]
MLLNPEQAAAVRHVDGPLLVFAGAGSGKTRVITNRIVHLIEKAEIPPSQIIALSFTNKSAREMESRLRKMMNRKALRGIILSTFHSLGLKILKEHIETLGYNHNFLLLNANDQEALVTQLLKNRKLDPKEIPPKEIMRRVSLAKNTKGAYLDRLSASNEEVDLTAVTIYEDYNKALKDMNSLDFDDLILLPSRIFKENPEIAATFHKKHKYFMVDEFQDTNELQYEFLTYLRGSNRNLCVVGDDDQSIYAFRGSNVQLILNFEREFPEAKVVRLLENYRSTSMIIRAANSLIKNNVDRRHKDLFSKIISHEKVEYFETQDEREEAIFVVGMIEDAYRKAEKLSQMAILFRTNFQSRPFEEELRMRNIPYKVVGGYNFFDRREVRDMISYLRIIANPKDESSLMRTINTPKRGIGQTTIAKLHRESIDNGLSLSDILYKISESPDYLTDIKSKHRTEIYSYLELIEKYRKKFAQSPKLAPILRELITESGMEKEILLEETDEKVAKARMYNLSELVNMLSFFEDDEDREGKASLFDFLARLALLMEDDQADEDQEDKRVQLLTIHQSKGLEFDTVYVVGIEEGILPNSRVVDEGNNVDEERRLFYVAMTRAKTNLLLTGAKTRRKYGETIDTNPSRFLEEIDPEAIHLHRLSGGASEGGIDFLKELERLKVG